MDTFGFQRNAFRLAMNVSNFVLTYTCSDVNERMVPDNTNGSSV